MGQNGTPPFVMGRGYPPRNLTLLGGVDLILGARQSETRDLNSIRPGLFSVLFGMEGGGGGAHRPGLQKAL